MRGLDEKIWKVFAPISRARSTAFDAPPVVPRCTPILVSIATVYKLRYPRFTCLRPHVEKMYRGGLRRWALKR
jgi:hypothetical protein